MPHCLLLRNHHDPVCSTAASVPPFALFLSLALSAIAPILFAFPAVFLRLGPGSTTRLGIQRHRHFLTKASTPQRHSTSNPPLCCTTADPPSVSLSSRRSDRLPVRARGLPHRLDETVGDRPPTRFSTLDFDTPFLFPAYPARRCPSWRLDSQIPSGPQTMLQVGTHHGDRLWSGHARCETRS